jgi:hypothetical protein
LRIQLSSALLVVFLFACASSEDAPDGGTWPGPTVDGGEPAADGGTTEPLPDAGPGDPDAGSDPDAGTLPDAGSEPPWDPVLGTACNYESNDCGEGRLCSSLYGDGQGGLDTATATCFAACTTEGAACTGALGKPGLCTLVHQFGGSGYACVVYAENLETCANSANSTCAQAYQCVLLGTQATCMALCEPANPVCPGTLRCSTSPLQVTMPAGNMGICAAPSSVGDLCNADPAEGAILLCTDGQVCGAEENDPYTCMNP